jgi:hypothetical protein
MNDRRHNYNAPARRALLLAAALCGASLTGCQCGGWGARDAGCEHDRPFPLGHVSDSFWETQQTNAEAADFVFYDHEFRGDTAELTPGAKRKLESVALRLEHVPFPVVIEQSPYNRAPELDQGRRQTVVEQLGRLGAPAAENRVVIAGVLAEGFTAVEGEQAYYQTLSTNANSAASSGRRFGGFGGMFR